MTTTKVAAILATVVLMLLMCFQALLALGLPVGKVAWGGEHRILPAKLRWSSLAAVFILALASWMVLARAGLVPPGSDLLAIRIMTWTFASYFALNVVMNLLSKSLLEKLIMTPAAAIIALCFVWVARS